MVPVLGLIVDEEFGDRQRVRMHAGVAVDSSRLEGSNFESRISGRCKGEMSVGGDAESSSLRAFLGSHGKWEICA